MTLYRRAYDALPEAVRLLADRDFELLKANPQHPSLHFTCVGRFRSVRVGLRYRFLGIDVEDGILWFWIGAHAEYDALVGPVMSDNAAAVREVRVRVTIPA